MFVKVNPIVSDVFFGFRLPDRPQYHINKPLFFKSDIRLKKYYIFIAALVLV